MKWINWFLSLNLAAVFSISARNEWTITSPGQTLKATIRLADLGGQADYPSNEVRLYYTVSIGGPAAYSEVVQPSPMGLIRSDQDFVSGLTFVSEGEQRTIDSTYTMVTGKRSLCRNYCHEKVLTFQASEGNSRLELHLRAYDDGFAFRYRFPETNASPLTITSEATGFRPPAQSIMWMLAYNTIADEYAPAYEDIWKRDLEAGAGIGQTVKPGDSTWCLPALYRTPAGCWALLWETGVTSSYCNTRLSKASRLVYRITFPNADEAKGLGSATPSSTLPWTILPFTRNAVASMDWTPVTFTNQKNPHKTTCGHELALSVIFESGIQHFADRVSGYQTSTISEGAQTFLKEVPVAWDDTKYLQGYPGSWLALARRKGSDWYAAGIAGDTSRNMNVKLSFLQGAPATYRMSLITDGTSATTFSESIDTVESDDSIGINTPACGGWVAKFVNLNPISVNKQGVAGHGVTMAGEGCFIVAGESIALPYIRDGKAMTISVYRLDGGLVKRATVESRIVHLKRDLRLSTGVYLVRSGRVR